MKFVSTRSQAESVSFGSALFSGLAPDGGLYMPDAATALPLNVQHGSLTEIAAGILGQFIESEIPSVVLERLVAEALNFPLPLVALDEQTSVLELFHGPTFSFKDVGARVMARLMAWFNSNSDPMTVLVATSGDTGSAIAHAFYGLAGTRVVVLFPSGRVAPVQEAQFTTLGGNITAVAVEGTFDDCQCLAKAAFNDRALREKVRLTSANSINLGRLLPQITYYVYAAFQMKAPVTFSVPSGNCGNLTAGLMAREAGAPIARLIAATTINDTFPRFLASGRYEPRSSVPTLANAMDVGDPSNVERLRWIVGDDLAQLRRVVSASGHTDADVRTTIRDVWARYGYVCDPHTAIGYLGLQKASAAPGIERVLLATAHPGKFHDVVGSAIGQPVPLPEALVDALEKPRVVQRLAPRSDALRDLLLMGTVPF